MERSLEILTRAEVDIVWKFSKESKSGACREDFMRDTFVEHRLSKVMKYHTIRYHSLSRVTASLDQCNGLPRPTSMDLINLSNSFQFIHNNIVILYKQFQVKIFENEYRGVMIANVEF